MFLSMQGLLETFSLLLFPCFVFFFSSSNIVIIGLKNNFMHILMLIKDCNCFECSSQDCFKCYAAQQVSLML